MKRKPADTAPAEAVVATAFCAKESRKRLAGCNIKV
jgi:hypothetical protein